MRHPTEYECLEPLLTGGFCHNLVTGRGPHGDGTCGEHPIWIESIRQGNPIPKQCTGQRRDGTRCHRYVSKAGKPWDVCTTHIPPGEVAPPPAGEVIVVDFTRRMRAS
jgi:hypothetical protein